MKTGEAGLTLCKSFEGPNGPELEAYQDSGGVWTIGYGHTKDVLRGDLCTTAQANDWLEEDLCDAEASVERYVTAALSQQQFDALVDFVFNLGGGALHGSTLLRCLNDGDYDGAAAQFLVWNKGHVNGKLVVERGLARRRQAEKELFES